MARTHSPSRRGWLARALAVSALLVPAAAAAAGKGGPGTFDKDRGTFAPGRDPVASYGAEAGKCPSGGTFRTVESELEAGARKNGRPVPRPSPALCAMAETFLGWDTAAGKPRDAVLAAASQWFGLAAPVGEVLVAVIEGLPADEFAASDVLAEKLVQPAARFALNVPAPRWGIAIQRLRRGVAKVALVLQDEPVAVTGLPRRLELGKSAKLKAAFAPGVKDPRVLVSDPRGALEDVKGGEAEVRCGDVTGQAVVEIRGELEGQQAVLASFAVGCGVDLPAQASLAPEPWPAEPEQQETRLLEKLGDARRAVGLGGLARDEDLVAIARKLSASFAGGGSGGDVGALMAEAGIRTPVAAQSAAADRDVGRAWERLLRSPTNRANLLNAEVDGAGIGIAKGTAPDGGPLVYMTALLVKEQKPIDVVRARDALRVAVVQKRKDARVGAVEPDAALEDLAQRYAAALAAASGDLPAKDAAALLAPAQKQWRVTALAGAREESLDLAEEPEVIGNAKALGVGMATGKHPKLGRHAAYAVILLGAAQGAAAEPKATKPAAKPAPKKPASGK